MEVLVVRGDEKRFCFGFSRGRSVKMELCMGLKVKS